MKCAPVLIPTLNRCEHLKQCIDSLRANSMASETEIMISVDYPPNDKYAEGYQRTVKYIKEGIEGFKQVSIFYQDVNIGPFTNIDFLKKQAYKRYERVIVTEDDNIFSLNFLEYMNTCLDEFEKDERIYAICGYGHPIHWKVNCDKTLIKNDCLFSGYGYGLWKRKEEELYAYSRENLLDDLLKFSNVLKLYKAHTEGFCNAFLAAFNMHDLMVDARGELVYVDATINVYLILNKKCVIMPTLSMVKNCGFDGSGLHCSKQSNTESIANTKYITLNNYDFSKQPVDNEADFDRNQYECVSLSRKNRKLLNRYIPISAQEKMKVLILAGLYVVFRDYGRVKRIILQYQKRKK